jgi:hypothetical protein
MEKITNKINLFKTGANRQQVNVAAVQADIVTHSMGGNVARTMVTKTNYLDDENYHQGIIHKLITIDAPHLGSQFANRLYNSSDLCKAAWTYKTGKKIADAVRDLQTTSAMITTTLQQKIFPLRAARINSVATPGQAATVEANFRRINWSLANITIGADQICGGLLPASGISSIYGTDTSDLIVSGQSQKAAGLGYNGTDSPTAISNGLIHAVDPTLFNNGPDALSSNIKNGMIVSADTPNPQAVINLLNSPIDAGWFGQILP